MNPRNHYADELKHEIVAFAMVGQSVASLVRQLEPTATAVHRCIRKVREEVGFIDF